MLFTKAVPMIINLELERDKQGKIIPTKNDQAAGMKGLPYVPPVDVMERTMQVMNDFQVSDSIRNRPFEEFNSVSMIDRLNMSKRSYNQWVSPPSDDAAQAWRSAAFRPIVRNKIIAIAAQVTATLIYPNVFAQNDNDEEDRDAAQVMGDLVEVLLEQGNYEESFLYAVLSALINPVSLMHVEFAESFRKIKEIKDSSEEEENDQEDIHETEPEDEVMAEVNKKVKYKETVIKDDLFSGYQINVVPCDELWIADPYTQNIQKQPWLIWRRVIAYSTAKSKYGFNENFINYVKPGVQFLFDGGSNTFYQQSDTELQDNQVEEVIYFNRTADLLLTFVNGVLLEDPDNPNPRKDKNYPWVKGGYETFDEGRFFYYKSLADKLSEDERIVNTAYQMIIDGTYLQIMPPAVMFGNEEIGSSVVMPGAVTNIDISANPNAAFQTIDTGNNLSAGYSLLDKVESSMTESSTSDITSGQAPQGQTTAFEISRIEQNSRTLLQLFGKMISFMVRDLGILTMNDALQFLTVGDVKEATTGEGLLKFSSFLLPKKEVDGKLKTRKVEFDMDMPEEATEDELLRLSEAVAEEQSKFNDDVQIYKVNPSVFRKLTFKMQTSADQFLPKSDALKKAQNLEAYQFALANPLSKLDAVTRTLLFGSFEATKNDPDKFMKSEAEMTPPEEPQQAQKTPKPNGGVESAQLSPEFQGAKSAAKAEGMV